MANIKLTKEFITGWQIGQMAATLNWCRHRTLGVYVQFLANTQSSHIEQGTQALLSPMLALPPKQASRYFAALTQSGLLPETAGVPGPTYTIVHNEGLLARHKRAQEVGRAAGKKSVAVKRAAQKPRARKAALAKDQATPPVEVAVETAAKALRSKAWAAYAEAYERRTGTPPVGNAKNHTLIKKVVDQLGQEAPDVLSFYCTHPMRLYANALWPLELASRDASGLRTQWYRQQYVNADATRQHNEMQAFLQREQQIAAGEL